MSGDASVVLLCRDEVKKKGFILFHTLLANSTLFVSIDAILPLCFSVACCSEKEKERTRQISFFSRVFSQKKKRMRQISLGYLLLFAFFFFFSTLSPEQAEKILVAAAPRSYPMITIHQPPSPSLLLIPICVQRSGTADCSILHSFQPASSAFHGPTQKALGNAARPWFAVPTHTFFADAESPYIFSISY